MIFWLDINELDTLAIDVDDQDFIDVRSMCTLIEHFMRLYTFTNVRKGHMTERAAHVTEYNIREPINSL